MTAILPALISADELGVYDLPAAAYHRDPVEGGSLSASGAKKLMPPSCPALFKAWRPGRCVVTDLWQVKIEGSSTDQPGWSAVVWRGTSTTGVTRQVCGHRHRSMDSAFGCGRATANRLNRTALGLRGAR